MCTNDLAFAQAILLRKTATLYYAVREPLFKIPLRNNLPAHCCGMLAQSAIINAEGGTIT